MTAEGYGRTLWTPDGRTRQNARISRYMSWLKDNHDLAFADYQPLWEWSVGSPAAFWSTIWDFFDVLGDRDDAIVLRGQTMPDVRWFEGATLNYARNMLRTAWTDPDRIAIVFSSERAVARRLTYADLAREVARVAHGLRTLAVRRGDRVAALLPNVPEAVIGLLATASIGAIWSSCSPDFGARSVIDRFAQIAPKVLLACDGYVYNGKEFSRAEMVADVAAALPGRPAVVSVSLIGQDLPGAIAWTALGQAAPRSDNTIPNISVSDNPSSGSGQGSAGSASDISVSDYPGSRSGSGSGPVGSDADISVSDYPGSDYPGSDLELEFEEVPFSHPLWVVYSSGTTGLPKPIMHGHGGIVLEHLKTQAFHQDLKPADVFTWYTTTGWMMWNYLVGGLLSGTTIVLYDGSAAYPNPDRLWRLAAEHRITYLGVGAPYLMASAKAGLRPGAEHDLSALRGIGSTGSPLPPEGFTWVYEQVKPDVLLGSLSGGTDVCTGFVGPCPLLPVRAGLISGRCLGAKVEAYDQDGKPVTGEVGELVLTVPLPSMPVGFWNDPGDVRYRESYFDMYPGVWRHGDWIEILPDGGCVIYGRSDATLNRGGVRMGTSEFYRVVEAFPEVSDSLVVDTGRLAAAGEQREGQLILYVVPAPGCELDDDLASRLRAALRAQLSPRHVPEEIHQVPGIPRTLSGKKLEVPVRRILLGMDPAQAVDRNALANPDVLKYFAARN
jgi:acetoacetyl-CoA synthetase